MMNMIDQAKQTSRAASKTAQPRRDTMALRRLGQARTTLLCTAILTVVSACSGTDEPRPGTQLPEALPSDIQLSYAAQVPSQYQVTVEKADSEGIVRFDATGSHRYFPLTDAPLHFENKHAMVSSLVEKLGGVEEFRNAAGELGGLRSTVQVFGDPIFEDRVQGLTYRVTEPILALVGGAHGFVSVGGELICLDADGECSADEYASYLEPIGEATAPTHTTRCDTTGRICVEFHTFFNQTWFPFPYARHGSNVQFVRNSALPTTRLTTGGFFMVGGTLVSMPTVSRVGVNSVETSVTCAFDTSCLPYKADTVCGIGSIVDPDVNASNVRTGNGPGNNTSVSSCP